MEIAPTLITIISSITFVIIGLLAFNVAALISGFSIYRELPPDHALLITITVGSILFILSPLGYLIFYPTVFVKSANGAMEMNDNYHYPPEFWGLVWSWDAMIPFALAFTGLGLVYGSFSVIELRWMMLSRFQRAIGIPFLMYSYGLTWDDYIGGPQRWCTDNGYHTRRYNIWGARYIF